MASVGSIIGSAYDQLANGTASSTSGTTSSGSSSGGSSSSSSTTSADPLANESTFLTLLVSQLKNQNPMSPMDGTTFVTQLAQFSDLEQNLAMRQDLDSLTAKYAAPATSSATSGNVAASGTSASGSSSQTTNN